MIHITVLQSLFDHYPHIINILKSLSLYQYFIFIISMQCPHHNLTCPLACSQHSHAQTCTGQREPGPQLPAPHPKPEDLKAFQVWKILLFAVFLSS